MSDDRRAEEVGRNLFVFSGITFALKVLPLESITIAEVNLGLPQRSVAVGMLAVATLYWVLVTSATVAAVILRGKINDLRVFDGVSVASDSPTDTTAEAIETLRPFVTAASIAASTLQSIFPIIFGILVFSICVSDVGAFVVYMFQQFKHP